MRTLKFNVKEQRIEKAKNCDFSDIASRAGCDTGILTK